uniref:hypothetical protein n=1 Tax=Ningiella ruwaisensis TaxID=2364274 RepID=UPI001446ADF8|nr:hypothetical protein [Ningiella ruwaisensis]
MSESSMSKQGMSKLNERRRFLQLCVISSALGGLALSGFGSNFAFASNHNERQSIDADSRQRYFPLGISPIALVEDAGWFAFAANLVKDEDAQVALLSAMRARPVEDRDDYYHPGSKGRVLSTLDPQDPRLDELINDLKQNQDIKLRSEKFALCMVGRENRF